MPRTAAQPLDVPAVAPRLAVLIPTVESALLDGVPSSLALDPADAAAGAPAGAAAAASLLRCIAATHAPRLSDGRAARAAAAAAAAAPLSTGIPPLDALLSGGLRPGWAVEVAGAAGSGKTQVCLATAAATVARLRRGRVLFLHSGGAFPAARLAALVRAALAQAGGGGGAGRTAAVDDATVSAALDRVTVAPVATLAGVGAALDAAATATASSSSSAAVAASSSPPPAFSLIVIDSLAAVAEPALLRAAGGGGGGGASVAGAVAPTTQGRAALLATARQAKALAAATGAALLLTNTATEWGSGGGVSTPTSWRPGLGEGWAPVPHVRLLLAPPGERWGGGGGGGGGGSGGGGVTTVAGPPRLAHLLAGPPPKDGTATTAAWRVPGEE